MVALVSESSEHRLFGRKRRANAGGESRREKRYVVMVTPEEDAQLRARAIVREVTVPRLLFESATAEDAVITDAEFKSVAADLMNIRSTMGYVSNNLNQLARFANTESRFPDEAEAAIADYRAVVSEYRAAMKRLAGA